MARLPKLKEFAKKHNLNLVSVADIIAYRRINEKLVERVAEAERGQRAGLDSARRRDALHPDEALGLSPQSRDKGKGTNRAFTVSSPPP